MKRKIIKLGPATLVISLPSKWIKKINIKAGEEIEINEENNKLIISKDKNIIKLKETLDFTKINKLLNRTLNAKYLKGCDEIEITVDTREKSRTIQKRVESMIGMEIIEQSKNRILLKGMNTDNEDNIDGIFKRILYLLQQISDESLLAIKNKETELKYLEDMELNINKFTDYCFRILSKKGYGNSNKTAVFYCIIYLLEELGDQYKELISFINKNKINLSRKLIDIYIQINSYHKDMKNLFLNYNINKSINLADERDKIIKDIQKEIEKTNNVKQIIILKNLENITNTIIKVMGQTLNIY